MDGGHQKVWHDNGSIHKKHDWQTVGDSHQTERRKHRSGHHEDTKASKHIAKPQAALNDVPLNSGKAYVYQWLARNEAERSKPTTLQNDLRQSLWDEYSHRHKDNRLKGLFGKENVDDHRNYIGSTEQHAVAQATLALTENRKRRRKDGSDSSLLKSPVKSTSHSRRIQVRNRTSKLSPRGGGRLHRQLTSSEDRFPGFSEPHTKTRKETFEKRARRKTREDRYEVKDSTKRRDKKKNKDDQEAGDKKEKQMRKVRKKPSRNNSASLMQNFISEKLSKDRLTV